jgi:hypothetical protein
VALNAVCSTWFTPIKREPLTSRRDRARPTLSAGGDATENSAIAEITLQNFRKTEKPLEELETAGDGVIKLNLLEAQTLQLIGPPNLQPGGWRFDSGCVHLTRT